MATSRHPRRIVVFALCCVTCLVVGACGDDDNNAQSGRPTPSSEIEATFKKFEDEFQSGNAAAACGHLSSSGQRDAAALTGGSDETCVDALKAFGRGVSGLEQKPSRILSVEVDGNSAVASVSDAGRPPVDVPFVREGGEWKLDQLAVGGTGG